MPFPPVTWKTGSKFWLYVHRTVMLNQDQVHIRSQVMDFHAIGDASFHSRENIQLFKTCFLIFPFLKSYLGVKFGFPRSRSADQMESVSNIRGSETTIPVSICFIKQ
jgi:hypothetical protein